MNWKLPHPAFAELLTAFSQAHTPVYVVGGAVRDMLLHRQTELTDLDLVVGGSAIPIARRVADQLGWAYYPLDEARDVARLVSTSTPSPLVCDIAGIRGGSIEADLHLRDFTVNALALAYTTASPSPSLIDTVGGQADLTHKLIRRVSPTSLADDPVRLLRAVRLAIQFDFRLEAETEAQLRGLAANVQSVSPERLRDELWKLLLVSDPQQGIELLREVGLLGYLLPEVAATVGVEQSLPHLYPVYEHTLNTVENAAGLRDWLLGTSKKPRNEAHALVQHKLAAWQDRLQHHFQTIIGSQRRRADWLVWYALCHDIGKPQTRTLELLDDGTTRTRFFEHETIGAELSDQRLTALRFNRNEVDLAHAVVRAHMRPHHLHMSFMGQTISRRASFRFFRDVGGKQTGIGPGLDVLLVALADRLSVDQEIPPDTSGYLDHVEQLLHYAFDEAPQLPLPLVDGHTLIKRLGVKPGPRLGLLMEHLMEAQAAGEIQTPEDALQVAAGWLEQDGA
ncbi:MAG: HD domain-containing protein [Caldilineaceae bacterium]|nr:HD domain-containing protein [Caldilineaceae bacterium]